MIPKKTGAARKGGTRRPVAAPSVPAPIKPGFIIPKMTTVHHNVRFKVIHPPDYRRTQTRFSQTKVTLLRIAELRRDGGTQPRASIHTSWVV
jgi:hypothetical protein